MIGTRWFGMLGAALVTAVGPAAPHAAAPAHHRTPDGQQAGRGVAAPHRFDVGSVRAGSYPVLDDLPLARILASPAARARSSHGLGLDLEDVAGTGPAIVDSSLADRGFATSATAGSVQLSWSPATPTTTYLVIRDEHVVGRVPGSDGYFDDRDVRSGRSYVYRVVPSTGSAQSWGTRVHVPAGGATPGARLAALRTATATQAAALVATTTTTLTWVAFIRQRLVSAPPAPACGKYGRKYEFGGDGHGFDWRSPRYRVALNAVIDWQRQTIASYPSVQATHVYRKSDGKLVAVRTASSSGLRAKYAGHGDHDVEIAMELDAHNPFCYIGQIDGGILIDISQTGSWAILSGSVRPMPDHLVYLWNNGTETDVWKARAVSAWCLIGDDACGVYHPSGAGTF